MRRFAVLQLPDCRPEPSLESADPRVKLRVTGLGKQKPQELASRGDHKTLMEGGSRGQNIRPPL